MAGTSDATIQRSFGAATALTAAIERAEHQRERHQQHARDHHVRVGVGDSRENCVVLEDAIESPEIHAAAAIASRTAAKAIETAA